jgi:hypothetical protein
MLERKNKKAERLTALWQSGTSLSLASSVSAFDHCHRTRSLGAKQGDKEEARRRKALTRGSPARRKLRTCLPVAVPNHPGTGNDAPSTRFRRRLPKRFQRRWITSSTPTHVARSCKERRYSKGCSQSNWNTRAKLVEGREGKADRHGRDAQTKGRGTRPRPCECQ